MRYVYIYIYIYIFICLYIYIYIYHASCIVPLRVERSLPRCVSCHLALCRMTA